MKIVNKYSGLFVLMTFGIMILFFSVGFNLERKFLNGYEIHIARASATSNLDDISSELKQSIDYIESNGLDKASNKPTPWYLESNENIILWNQEIKRLFEEIQLVSNNVSPEYKESLIKRTRSTLYTYDGIDDLKFNTPVELIFYPYGILILIVGLYLSFSIFVISVGLLYIFGKKAVSLCKKFFIKKNDYTCSEEEEDDEHEEDEK